MVRQPTLSELERAILTYTSPTSKEGVKEWQAMEWLWGHLSWSARFVTHFGASGSSWWKERYVFPALCEEALPYLQRFLSGAWTRAEEESLRHCFHFFVPYALKEPTLFPEEVAQFLSGTCPSFNTEREMVQNRLTGKVSTKHYSWLKDETFARYCLRMKSLADSVSTTKIVEKGEVVAKKPPESFDVITTETKDKAKKIIDEMVLMREGIEKLSSEMADHFGKIFPLHREADQDVEELKEVKEEALSLLLSIDKILVRFSDLLNSGLTDVEARRIIHEAEKSMKWSSDNITALRTKGKRLCESIEELRNSIVRRLQRLTRLLDHIPMLETSNPFRTHQMRVVRIGREKLKRFRGALSKGPGPDTMLVSLEKEIDDIVELARAFYDEGADITAMKERLHHIEHIVQKMVEEGYSLEQVSKLQSLLAEVRELKTQLEITPDRKRLFERIIARLREVDPQKVESLV